MASLLKWKPIKNAPRQKYPLIVVHGFYPSGLNDRGYPYTTDPWCVFWHENKWERWPHRRRQPTHYIELPDNIDDWEPIKNAPRQTDPVIVVMGHYPSQRGYINTEPCCVFWKHDEWARWPYSNINPPTHYLKLPPLIRK
jgi:hypothetical protein